MDGEPEKSSQESGTLVSDPTLFNNFWLNEIKSLDDSSRILLSVNILLLSAYLTIIATNFEKITAILNAKDVDLPNLIMIFIPSIGSWFFSIDALMRTHLEPPLDAKPLLDTHSAKEYLIKMYGYKRACISYSFNFLIIPFIYIFFMNLLILIFMIPDSSILSYKSQESFFLAIISTITIYLIIVFSIKMMKSIFELRSAFFNIPLPTLEPELTIKADEAGAYYEYKTKAKH